MKSVIKSNLKTPTKSNLFILYHFPCWSDLGVFNRPFDSIMPTLEIKQLLYDTLSWVYADGAKYLAYGSSVLDETVSVMKRVQSIYLSNEKEVKMWQAGLSVSSSSAPTLFCVSFQTPEMIVKAFQFSTFSKITEFQSFRDRLRFSVNKRILATQLAHAIIRIRFLSTAKIVNPKLFVDAVAGMVAGVADTGHQGGKGGLDVEDEEYWERMAENRDLGIMVNWSSNKTPIQNQLHDVGVAHHGATPLLDVSMEFYMIF